MPSITDLPRQELRNSKVAFKVLEENLGDIVNPNGDGNCAYYAIFEAFTFLGKDRGGKKLHTYQQRYSIARSKRMELVKFGKKNVDHFVRHSDATVPPKLVQLLPEGHSHLFGLNAPNLKTKQDRIDAFMATIGNTVYTEEFDNQDRTEMEDRWYLEATSTCPLIAYKFNINFTIYNVNAAMTNYFYHYKCEDEEQIYYWMNEGLCKPVENSCVLLLHNCHYWCIKARGTEKPTINPGKLILAEISRRASFDIGNVDSLDMDKDDNDNESDKDSEVII